jgi:hypothetical protein
VRKPKPVLARVSDPLRGTFVPDLKALALPQDLQNELHKFQIAEYAAQFFRERRSGKLFGRTTITSEALSCFQADPLTEPLLDGIAPTAIKPAIEIFKLILAYTGADPNSKTISQPSTVERIVSQLTQLPELRDEIFFQLIKQTRENHRWDVLQFTWELFLIVATVFPSSRNSEDWIKTYLYGAATGPDQSVADIAQFTYIRFDLRCQIGRPLKNPTPEMFAQFVQDCKAGHQTFGASVYEQLWNQRLIRPKMPVPYIVHEMAQALLAKGAETYEGIFRVSGNLKKVKEMEEIVNNGGDVIKTADLNDLASLFKSWFASLPESLVTDYHLGPLKTAFERRTHLQFVATLPKAHYFCLKYLIGFLQRLVRAEDVTRMTAKNLAIVFAPNIVYSGSVTDPAALTRHGEVAHDFIITLIETWDVTDMYPPPEAFLQVGK